MRAVNDDIEDGLLTADEGDETANRARKRIRRADAHLVAGAVRGNSKHRRKRARDQPDVTRIALRGAPTSMMTSVLWRLRTNDVHRSDVKDHKNGCVIRTVDV